ncbi:MAG: DUF1697 domain-containing protein [Candidatus Pacebacteria bacterium]|nr:DUF1697 domain-containing protein [Candidatus Paceibacterota bacterium]
MQYVALLRGINVGGNNKVAMSELKKVCEDLGFAEVRTYINSGNVMFSAPKKSPRVLADTIEKELHKAFGFPIRTVVRDAASIQALAKALPGAWANDTEQRTDVLFLWDDYDSKKTLALIKQTPSVDTLQYMPGAIVWHVKRKDINKSGMRDFIGTEVYKHMTARNVNTVRKIATLLA